MGRFVVIFCVLLFVAMLLKHFYAREIDLPAHSLKLNFQEGDPLSLNPHVGIDMRCRTIERLLYEGLTRVDQHGICQLAAAQKLRISPDQKTYTFTIRPHLWSNGKPVKAHHFATAWKRALAPDSLCMRSDLFYIIKNAKEAKLGNVPLEKVGIKALDDRTLEVDLEHPAPYFLDLLTHPIFSPLYNEEEIPTIFNGPFTLQEWQWNVDMQLVRNPHYWDKSHVPLHKIIIYFIRDPMTVLSLFEQGEIDYIGDPMTPIPLDAVAAHKKRLSYQDVARTYWIYINTEKFPFTSSKIRRAFAYAVDRKMITEHIFQGCIPHKSPVPKNLSLLEEQELYADADAIHAVQLFEEGLKELGLTRETLPPVVLSYSTLTGQKTLAEAIQERWKNVFGIDVSIAGSEWSVLASYFTHGQFQMGGCLRSAMYNDPLYHLEIFKEKDFPYNASLWENEPYKQLITSAVSSASASVRLDYLKRAEKMLIEEMPVIPLFVDTYKYMTNRGLRGFIIDKSGCIDFKAAYLDPGHS